VKEIYVQLPTYEVAHALERNLSKRIGKHFSSNEEQHRLVAVLLALRDLGSINSTDRGEETWFFFDPAENLANDVLQIKLNRLEMRRSIKLSKCIAPTLRQVWRGPYHSPETAQ
jgi:hypothetical protein